MEHEAAQGVAHKRPIYRSDTVGDGEHGPHERADEHGAHDGDVGVGVQANARNDHCDDEDAQVRAGESGPVDKALADHMVGRASFADIEGAANEFLHTPPGALQRRPLAVASPMAIDVLLPHVVVSGQSLFTCRSDSQPTLLARAAILALLGHRDISACRPSALAGALTGGLRAFSRLFPAGCDLYRTVCRKSGDCVTSFRGARVEGCCWFTPTGVLMFKTPLYLRCFSFRYINVRFPASCSRGRDAVGRLVLVDRLAEHAGTEREQRELGHLERLQAERDADDGDAVDNAGDEVARRHGQAGAE